MPVYGYITRWRPATGEGLVRLADMRPFEFRSSALAYGSGTPSVGQQILVARIEGDIARLVHVGGRLTHPSGPFQTPFRAVIESVARGDVLGRVGGIAYHEQACVGFAPAVGQEVWVAAYAVSDAPIALTLFSLDDAPPDIAASEQHARDAEAEEQRRRVENAIAEQRAREEAEASRAAERELERVRDHADAAYAARAAAAGWRSEADDPLLAEILANPDDDDVRRVFADSLIAEGNAFGELIAAQLAATRDLAREAELLRIMPARWKPPRGLADVELERGFLVRATLERAVAPCWQLGTLEELRVGKLLPTYRKLLPALTALRVIDVRALDVAGDCPSRRLTGVRGMYRDRAQCDLDWIRDIHLEVTDRAWPQLLAELCAGGMFANRRAFITSRGSSYIARREQLVDAWRDMPVSAAAVWDIGFERTARGTLARFAGWPSISSDDLIYPGIQILARVVAAVPDLHAIETVGAQPPHERDRAALAALGIEIRHTVRVFRDPHSASL